MEEIRIIYQKNVSEYQIQYQKLNKTYNLVAYLRLAAFILGAIAVYFLYPINIYFGLISGGVFLTFFLFLIKRHNLLADKRQLLHHLILINEKELRALEGDHSKFDPGEEFRDPTHNYTYDLDIFGQYSLFQFLNRTSTFSGRQLLARSLSTPQLDSQYICTRQNAIRSLVDHMSWTQYFQALGMSHGEKEEELERIYSWAKKPGTYLGNRMWNVMLIGIPLLFWVSSIAWTISLIPSMEFAIPGQLPVLLFLLQLGITGNRIRHTNTVHAQVGKKSGILTKYSQLFAHVTSLQSEDEYLNNLLSQLYQGDTSAHEAIEGLRDVSQQFDQRLNIVVAVLLNGTFLWDLRTVRKLEKWVQGYGEKIEEWFDILGEIDMMISLSRISLNHPDFGWPEIVEDPPQIHAKEMGHPLLPSVERVNNPLHLEQPGNFWLITGANMAGKSTYLRAVGVNIVLALAGAPVCARSFRLSPMPLLTSMRATDSLASHTSYFLAELKVLKHIVQQLDLRSPAFIMVDEMLRGTNSRDKQTGSRRFIEQLMRKGGMGLVATHDLSLGTLEEEYPGKIFNMCFEIQIDGDQLSFDYQLREGISQNLNATFLMEKMGIMD